MGERTCCSDRLTVNGGPFAYGASSPPSAEPLSVFEPVEAPH